MQVFKSYFKILEKHKFSIIIYSAIFLAITLVMTMNGGNQVEKEFRNSKISLHVVNEDDPSKLVDSFLKYLESYANFIELEDNEEARKDALFYGDISYILTIPKGFTEDFLAGKEVTVQKQSMPGYSGTVPVDNAIDNYFHTVRTYQKYLPDRSFEEIHQYVLENLEHKTTVEINASTDARVNNSNEFNQSYFNYLGYVLIGSLITSVSLVMTSFREINIKRRHTAAPISTKSLNLQLLMGNLIFTVCYLFLFILAGYIYNKYRRIDGNTLLFWLNGLVFALTTLSLSYLIGITVKNKKAVGAISTALSLSMAFISGIFVPQQYLGNIVLKLASFTPAYWFVRTNNTIGIMEGFSTNNLSEVFGMMAIQLGFGAALISIALVVSKRKSQ